MRKKIAGTILGLVGLQYGILGVIELSIWMTIMGMALGLVGFFLWTYDEL